MAKKKGAEWMSWTFVADQLARGMLQAVGALLVYALAIWLIIANSDRFGYLKDALALKAPMLDNRVATGSRDPPGAQ